MTQPPLLGCLLVHRFPLWVLYRQRLLAFCADNIKTGGGGAHQRIHANISHVCALGPQQSFPSQCTLWSGTPSFSTDFPSAARFFTAPSGHLTATACLNFSQAHCPRYFYYLCHLQLPLVPRLLAFQRSNDHISLPVGIAGSLFSLLFANSSCCVHRMFLSCQHHARFWTKYPTRSPILPLHPLATLLSYCMLPYYTLLTLVLPISPTFSGAVLHRFVLPTFEIH